MHPHSRSPSLPMGVPPSTFSDTADVIKTMTDLGGVIIVTVCVLIAIFCVRLLVNDCLSAQRYKLRDNYENLANNRRCERDPSTALLLPISGGRR